jgi:hypothetical protein
VHYVTLLEIPVVETLLSWFSTNTHMEIRMLSVCADKCNRKSTSILFFFNERGISFIVATSLHGPIPFNKNGGCVSSKVPFPGAWEESR